MSAVAVSDFFFQLCRFSFHEGHLRMETNCPREKPLLCRAAIRKCSGCFSPSSPRFIRADFLRSAASFLGKGSGKDRFNMHVFTLLVRPTFGGVGALTRSPFPFVPWTDGKHVPRFVSSSCSVSWSFSLSPWKRLFLLTTIWVKRKGILASARAGGCRRNCVRVCLTDSFGVGVQNTWRRVIPFAFLTL